MRIAVVADDRTGAFETAAAIADRTGTPVPVAVWPDAAPARLAASVVDLASRHLDPDDAAARSATVDTSGRCAHKIDSTLRGNWASELAARHRASGARVLLVPALPELGRTCQDGVVLLDGIPVHLTPIGHDVRGGPATSRPAELLTSAGVRAADVVELHDLAAVARWFRDGVGIAVADAANADTIDAIVDRWHRVDGVLLAGTSEVVGAAVGRPRGGARRSAHADLATPVLVVCGSASPVAREQIDHAVTCGAVVTDRIDSRTIGRMQGGTPVILCSPTVTGPVTHEAARAAASRLVAEAAAVIESGFVGTLVVIGGDTAAALLGDALVMVHGSVVPGTAMVESLVCDVPVITRAGGFGGADALSGLLWDTLAS